MSVAASYISQCTVVETLATNVPAASSPQITHSLFNTTQSLNAASTVPATTVAAFNQALTAGSATIDLTAVLGTNGATVSLSGLKVQIFKVIAKATNANPITVKAGASNGYNMLGAAWQIILNASQEALFFLNDTAPDVGGSAKTIDLSGTGTQSVDIILVAG